MSFGHFLQHDLIIKNPTGNRSKTGRAALGVGTVTKGRFQRKYKTIVTAEKEREPIHGEVWIAPDTTCSVGAQITYDSDLFRVIEIAGIPLGNGKIHHQEALVQLWSYAS